MKRVIIYISIIFMVLIIVLSLKFIINIGSDNKFSNELNEEGGVQIILSLDKTYGIEYSKKDINLAIKIINSYLNTLGYKTKKVEVDKSNNVEIEIVYDEFIASSEIIPVVDNIRNGTIPRTDGKGIIEKLPIKFGPISMRTIYPSKLRKSNP